MVSTPEEGAGLPFRIWQPCFKLCQIPALPSLCRNVSFSTEGFYCPTFPLLWWHWGTKTGADPTGACAQAHHLDAHCDSGITSLLDVTSHCVGLFLCLWTKREREKRKQSRCLLWSGAACPLYNASGGQLCSNLVIVVVLEKLTFKAHTYIL